MEGAAVDVSGTDSLVKLSRRREKNNTRGIECVWYLHYLQSDETGSLQSWHIRLTLHSPTKKRRYDDPAVAESYQGSIVHVVHSFPFSALYIWLFGSYETWKLESASGCLVFRSI